MLPLPDGYYTGHVRDPNVATRWEYMVLVQDVQKHGKVLLFTSSDLQRWQPCGEIAGHGVNGLSDAGYMGVSDLFALDGDARVDLLSAGAEREPHRYPVSPIRRPG